MLKIRLKRTGKKHEPHYRIVVIDSRKARDSRSIADIGYYNPRTKPSTFEIDQEVTKDWMKKGAQPTETVMRYLVKLGVMEAPKKGSKLGAPKAKKKAEK